MRTPLMTRLLALGTATAAASAVGVLTPTAAQADDDRRGTTTIAPSEATRKALLAVLRPARLTSASAAEFPITSAQGNRIAHVGGLKLRESNSRTSATSLTLRNFVIDTGRGTVSAVVNGGDRAVVFTLGSGGALSFTDVASQALTGGSSLTGALAGTAKVALADRDDDDRDDDD